MNIFKALLLEEEGQGMVEYILIIAVVALIVVGGIKLFGDKLKDLFDKKAGELEKF
ncbi:Flp family type IVb pilin [bacterium]|nr:Flp family type IVb pilin [bacterium]